MPVLDQKFETGGVGLTITLNVGVTAGGSDRAVVVAIGQFDYATGPSGVTCNGVAMSQIDTGKTNGTNHVSIWYIANPAAGAAVIIATWAAATGARILASSWTGVNQTTPMASFVSASGTSTAPSVAATNASGAVAIDVAVASKKALTGGSGTALSVANNAMGSQYSTSVNPTMSWVCSSAAWAICAASLQASSTVSPPITGGVGAGALTVTASELRVVPMRAGPTFSMQTVVSGAAPDPATTENNGPAWEASGMFPGVVMGTIDGAEIVYDTVWTLPSVAPSGVIAFTGMPTKNSPSGSLVVTTQDAIITYPFSYGVAPNIVPCPRNARSRSDASYTTDHVPVAYPSTWDAGDVPHMLVGVHILAEQMTPDVDAVGISWRAGDTAPWSTAQFAWNTDAFFPILGENFGTRFSLSVSIYDAVSTDPIGPGIIGIIPWFEELDVDAGSNPELARSTPEVA